MRILYILTSLGVGGAEKQVIALAEGMAARGHSVQLLTLKHVEEECAARLPVLRLNLRKSPLGVLRGLIFARKFLALFPPDVMHAHTFPANIFARLLLLLRNRTGKRPILINTIHNVYEGGWHRMLAYRLTDTFADAVTAVSSAAAERFLEKRAVSRQKLSVLTNGIDTHLFIADRKIRKATRTRMLTGDAFVWIAVGRLVPAKDYPNLLRAFTHAQLAHPSAQLWILGEGDPAAFQSSHSSGGDQPIQDNHAVRWLGLQRDIAPWLNAADAYVLSSAWEGMPLSLGEAMAMEKPVVATDVGGVLELAGDIGILVPPHNSEALAEAMSSVMTISEQERRSIGRAARDRIEQHFSMESKVKQWEELYRKLTKRDSSSAGRELHD